MSAAALGAGARPLPPLPDGADSSAALTACASSAGGALALLALLVLLALASAAPDIISAAPAQMRAAVANLPMDMLSLPLRRLRSAQVRFSAPGPAAPSTSSSIAMVSSWFCGRGSARRRTKTGHASPLDWPNGERTGTTIKTTPTAPEGPESQSELCGQRGPQDQDEGDRDKSIRRHRAPLEPP